MAMEESKKDEFYELCQSKVDQVKIKVVGKDDIEFSSVINYVDQRSVEFTMKRIKGKVPAVKMRDKLDINATLNNGQQLLFYCKVTQTKISDDPKKPSILKCNWPDDYAKKQLRQDVRIRAALQIYYSDKLNAEGRIDKEDQYVGLLSDISRGGTFVLTREKPIFKGNDIYIYFYVNDEVMKMETILMGKVVVVKAVGKGKAAKCQGMAVQFTNLNKKTEEDIISWIYERQRLLLKERKSSGRR